MTAFLMIFRRFPKIFQNCSKGQTNVPEHVPRISENFRRCPKISEDCRRLPRKTRRCFDHTPTNFSTISETNLISPNHRYLHMWRYHIFTCEDIISSHVRISYRFYQFVTTRYTTDFYIINVYVLMATTTVSLVPCAQSWDIVLGQKTWYSVRLSDIL